MQIFNSHFSLAQNFWQKALNQAHPIILDATCGNGYDTLYLTKHLTNGKIFGIDIQEKAIFNTKELLEKKLTNDEIQRVFLKKMSHEHLEELGCTFDLIVYNLGYLPTSDKSIKTHSKTTLISIQKAMNLLNTNGIITIMCYPGHLEGEEEEKELLKLLSKCDPKDFEISHHSWINRLKAPCLFYIKKNQKKINS